MKPFVTPQRIVKVKISHGKGEHVFSHSVKDPWNLHICINHATKYIVMKIFFLSLLPEALAP